MAASQRVGAVALRFRAHWVAAGFLVATFSLAQDSSATKAGSERAFPQTVAAVQAALQKLPGGASGRLPVLDGFVVPGSHPLSGYQSPYYHCEVKVTPVKSGGSRVRATAKITAWFNGPGGSGYEALESNGRVESDLLDRLQDALAPPSISEAPASKRITGSSGKKAPTPDINAPMPRLPDHPDFPIGAREGETNPQNKDLQQEAKNLEEILRNQSHPTNLIAVRKDDTPVLQNPIVDAKVLFLANEEDEFEVLDETPGWVHVRISGLSRGWLRRSAVEMPGDSPAASGDKSGLARTKSPAASDSTQSPAPFSVSSEETGSFPGDWAPLRGKNVRIISLQQASGTGRITSPQEKKQFAGALFKKESSGHSTQGDGLVLIFDAEDGGMVATTRAALEQWNSGVLSEAEFWKRCFLDPPEILGDN
jgi:hypothetical protein